jgi:hypothetical protein
VEDGILFDSVVVTSVLGGDYMPHKFDFDKNDYNVGIPLHQ